MIHNKVTNIIQKWMHNLSSYENDNVATYTHTEYYAVTRFVRIKSYMRYPVIVTFKYVSCVCFIFFRSLSYIVNFFK